MNHDMAYLTSTEGGDQFYPTPDDVAQKMLSGIEWHDVKTVLEPSAGKGNLIHAVLKAKQATKLYGEGTLSVDCIEIDPNLRGILNYSYCGARKKELNYEIGDLQEKQEITASERTRLRALQAERDTIAVGRVCIVHDDFLTYAGYKRYDLVVMNPPFANGERHLLKALDMQKQGGQIICLLNAETIRNPYTSWRRQLKKELDRNNASVTYIKDGFATAERRTNVEIALIKVNIPVEQQESEIYSRMWKAKETKIDAKECEDLVAGDYFDQIFTSYQVEVESSLRLIQLYEDMRPYMSRNLDENAPLRETSILTLTVGSDKNYLQRCEINEYLREVRLKYWRYILARPEFTGKLTSNLCEKYMGMVDDMAGYDFTRFNAKQILAAMNAEMVDGLKDTIMKLFEKLCGHSYYGPESGNVHFYDGWKTNKAHKVAKKVIIPCYGVVEAYPWSKLFNRRVALNLLADIEKSFNYLDGGMTQEVHLETVLDQALEEGLRSGIQCKYFTVDIYKKGTVHIRFHPHCMQLVEKLNIYAGRDKNWLPPCYGKVKYTDMNAEEQAVVDKFQGKAAYAEVLVKSSYYLAEPDRAVPALAAARQR